MTDRARHLPRIMLDIETLGQTPGSAILAIGAVLFDGPETSDDPKTWPTFYHRIDHISCERFGLKADMSTVLWWMRQNDAARAEMCLPGDPLDVVLREFTMWLVPGESEIWGCGPSFDNALLAEAFRAVSLPVPWKHWNERCYRTIKSLFPHVRKEDGKVAHNALTDAMDQAKHAVRILREIIPAT